MRPSSLAIETSAGNPRLPKLLIIAAVAIPVVLAAWMIWAGQVFFSNHVVEETRAAQLSQGAARIMHLDEVLTMSARMAAATGDKAWIDRYLKFEPELDRIIQEVKTLAPTVAGLKSASATDQANVALVRMEHRSFDLVLQGKKDGAWSLLTGSEYERQKQIYAAGMKALVQEVEARQEDEMKNGQLNLKFFLIGQGLMVVLFLALWSLALWAVTSAWRHKADQLKGAAEELQLREQKYRTLFEGTTDAVMLLDGGGFLECNPVALRIFGCARREECLRAHPSKFSPPRQPDGEDSRLAADRYIAAAMRDGSAQFEWQHCHLDGTEFPAEVWLTRMALPTGAILQAVVRDITKRKSLEAEQRRLATILEGTSNFVGFADANLHILYFNKAGRLMLGLTPDEDVTKRTITEFLPEWANRIMLETAFPIMERVGEWAGELAYLHQDGHEIPILLSALTLKDSSGKVEIFSAIAVDITERKLAEAALRESEARFHGVVDNIGIGVTLVNPQLEVLFVNQQMKKWYPNLDISRRPKCYQAFNSPPRADACTYCPTRLTLQDGQIHESITDTPAGDKTIHFRIISSPIKDKEGRISAAIEMVEDITERKRAEEALAVERENLKAIFESSPTGMLLMDEKLTVTTVNDVAAKLAGKSAAEMLKVQPGEALGCLHAADVPAGCGHGPACQSCPIRAVLAGVLESGQPARGLEVQPELGTGESRSSPWLEISATPVTIDGRRHVIASIVNITNRKQAEEQLAHLATHDSLTGLPNRRLFEEALRRAMARANRGVPSTLLLFDVDHFKAVNDAFGHAGGDEVLVQVSRVVQQQLRTEDILARMGGDEFAVLLEGVDLEAAQVAAERMRAAASGLAAGNGPAAHPTLSIGMARISAGQSVEELIKRADAACYQAKALGRNRVVCLD